MQFDHVEVYVTDRKQAVELYHHVLGFHPVVELADWSLNGPLMIANNHKQMIALFEGPAQGSSPLRGFRRVAFRVSAGQFQEFLKHTEQYDPKFLTKREIRDHRSSFSVYFPDPFGNQLEVTTYEYEAAKQFLTRLATHD